jgi:hypothetical protein
MLNEAGSGAPFGGLMTAPASFERSSKLPALKLLLAMNTPAKVFSTILFKLQSKNKLVPLLSTPVDDPQRAPPVV